MAKKLVKLYDPQEAPLHSLASFRSPMACPFGSGLFPGISNFRWGDDGILTARAGTSQLTSAPIQVSDSGTSTGSNTTTTLKDTGKAWTTNIFIGAAVILYGGTGSGQTSFVTANTSNTLTVSPAWGTTPDATSQYKIAAEPRALKTISFAGISGKLVYAAKDWVTHKTSVYLTSDPTNFGAAITPSSGQYGDCRFSADASGNDYPLTCAVVSDRFTGKDVLVMENGYDNPRVYDGTTCAPHQAISQPAQTDGCVSRVWPQGAMSIGQGSVTFPDSSDSGTSTGGNTSTTLKDTGKAWTVNAWAGMELVITSATGRNQRRFITSNTSNTITVSSAWTVTPDATSTYTISQSVNYGLYFYDNAGAAIGSTSYYLTLLSNATSGFSGTATATCSSANTFSGTPQHCYFTVGGTTAMINDWLANFKIEVYGTVTATWYTIHDPTQSTGSLNNPVQVLASATQAVTCVVMPFDNVSAATSETSVKRIRFTPVSTAPAMSGNLSLPIYGFCVGGNWPGLTSWAVADYNSASRAIGPKLVLTQTSSYMSWYGMSTTLGTVQFPLSDQMSYNVYLYATRQTAADANNGVDTRLVFAQLTDEVDSITNDPQYTYLQSFTIATYSGSWSRAAAWGSSNLYQQTVTGKPTDRLLWLTAPNDYVIPIPIGRSIIAGAASRLLVGARHEAQDSFPRVALGEGGNGLCFRFASAPNLDDPVTSYEDRIPSESIQAFSASAASTFPASQLYAFTERSLFSVDPAGIGTPVFLRRISSHGLMAPNSIAEHNGFIFYLDTDLRIQEIGGYRSNPISLGWIDDKLNSIPTARSLKAQGFWYKDRYYMPYTPSGGTRNTRILVYSQNAGGWESDDILPSTMSCECAVIQRDGNQTTYGAIAAPKVLMIGQDCMCYQYETGTTDVGSSSIAVSLTAGDLKGMIQQSDQESVMLGRMHFLIDGNTGTITTTHSYKPDGSTATMTTQFVASTSYDWVKSPMPAVSFGSGQGYGVNASTAISGSLAGGTRIHSIAVEIEPTDQIARQST